jgi:hypothetical protein
MEMARLIINNFVARVSQAKIVNGPTLQGKVFRLIISLDKSRKDEKTEKNQTENQKSVS